MKFKLKWYHFYLILCILGALFYFLKQDITYIFLGFCILTFYYVWKWLFCGGKIRKDGTAEFNLSSFAELILILFFISIIISSFYYLFQKLPVWYEWILPIIYGLVFLAKAIDVKRNMNDGIIIKNNEIQWKDDGNHKMCNAIRCDFYQDESESFSITMGKNYGWFLEIIDDQKQKHILDLKTFNLNGHKNSIEKYLIKQGLMKAEVINSKIVSTK